jgi:hypothetical protein
MIEMRWTQNLYVAFLLQSSIWLVMRCWFLRRSFLVNLPTPLYVCSVYWQSHLRSQRPESFGCVLDALQTAPWRPSVHDYSVLRAWSDKVVGDYRSPLVHRRVVSVRGRDQRPCVLAWRMRDKDSWRPRRVVCCHHSTQQPVCRWLEGSWACARTAKLGTDVCLPCLSCGLTSDWRALWGV